MPRQNGFFVGSKVNTFKKYKITEGPGHFPTPRPEERSDEGSNEFLRGFGFKGQASFEYFVLFILLAFFCLGGLFQVFPSLNNSIDEMFVKAVKEITDYK